MRSCRLKSRRCQDWSRHGDGVAGEEDHERYRKLGTGDGPSGGCTKRLFDAWSVGEDDFQGTLGKRCRKVGCAREKLDQLAPADGAVVRIGSGLRQHRIQAIIEPHR